MYDDTLAAFIFPVQGGWFASVAQSVEQGTENPRVIGSIPIGDTRGGCTVLHPLIYAELAHLVERHLAKVEVASSSLVFRSILCESCFLLLRGRLFFV